MADWNSTSKLINTGEGATIGLSVVKTSYAPAFFSDGGFVIAKGGYIQMPFTFLDMNGWKSSNYYDHYRNGSLIHTGNFYHLFSIGTVKVGIRMNLNEDISGYTWYFEIYTYKDSEIELAERMAFFYPDSDFDYEGSNLNYICASYVYQIEGDNPSEGIYVGRWWQRLTPEDPYFCVTMESLRQNEGDIDGAIARFTPTHGASDTRPLSYGGVKIEYDTLEDGLSNSSTGGGRGDYALYSDDIDIPILPNLSALQSGLISLYNPTQAQIQSLAGYLWSDSFLDELSRIFQDPFSLIISLGIVPFIPSRGLQKSVHIGGLNTNINMLECSSQYKQIDCGTLKVKELFGSSLDYNPYTQISLFLPFIGVVPLNIDEIMDLSIRVVYNIDVLSGAFACVVQSIGTNIKSVLYHFSGNCLTPIPLTSSSHSGLYSSVLNIASATIGGAISGGTGGAVGGLLSSSAKETLTSKTSVSRSGSISGNAGLLDNMKPYFIVERAIQSLPTNYKHYMGYPSNISYRLSQLKGFTKVESVISNVLTCTQDEQNEIVNLLKEGVFL